MQIPGSKGKEGGASFVMSLIRPNIKLPSAFQFGGRRGAGGIGGDGVRAGVHWLGVVGGVAANGRVNLKVWALPQYTMFSLFRGFVAYGMSLIFTLIYGRVAAYNKRAEKLMMPLLDILQSIPVLGFLPGLVLALVAIFPAQQFRIGSSCVYPDDLHRTGLEHDVQFLSIPPVDSCRSLGDASLRSIAKPSWQRFLELEVPSIQRSSAGSGIQ